MTHIERFYQLHRQAKPFFLVNVWNVKSARIVEACGFEAMATSSGAISDSLGYKDGEQIPFDELLYVIKRIRSGTAIPLSVDFERGYTDDLMLLNEYVQRLIDAGVVGINLEDAQGEDIYLKKLDSIKNYLTKTNQQLFVNARTDGFLQKLPSPLEVTLKRAGLYRDAGADGLFVTGINDAGMIREIVASTTLPVNIVSGPSLPVAALTECGVKRISMAVLLYRATYGKMEIMAKDILSKHSLEPLF